MVEEVELEWELARLMSCWDSSRRKNIVLRLSSRGSSYEGHENKGDGNRKEELRARKPEGHIGIASNKLDIESEESICQEEQPERKPFGRQPIPPPPQDTKGDEKEQALVQERWMHRLTKNTLWAVRQRVCHQRRN